MGTFVSPKDEKEETAILKVAIKLIRAKYKEVCIDYRALGTKIFTLIATELAVITFIFANHTKFDFKILYNDIFFSVGVTSLVISLGLLFFSVHSNRWSSPGDLDELEKLGFATELEFLRYLKADYLVAYKFCRNSFNKRRVLFDIALMLFVVGAIILMVLKFGGIKT